MIDGLLPAFLNRDQLLRQAVYDTVVRMVLSVLQMYHLLALDQRKSVFRFLEEFFQIIQRHVYFLHSIPFPESAKALLGARGQHHVHICIKSDRAEEILMLHVRR